MNINGKVYDDLLLSICHKKLIDINDIDKEYLKIIRVLSLRGSYHDMKAVEKFIDKNIIVGLQEYHT